MRYAQREERVEGKRVKEKSVRLSPGRKRNNAKTDEGGAEDARTPDAIGRATVRRIIDPRTAPQHFSVVR